VFVTYVKASENGKVSRKESGRTGQLRLLFWDLYLSQFTHHSGLNNGQVKLSISH